MTRSEAIKVLKDPSANGAELLTVALESLYSKNFLVKDFYDSDFVRICLGNDGYIGINTEIILMKDYGVFDVTCQDKIVNNLEKYFRYPLLPAEEERTLFEIEFGFEYPLKMDKAQQIPTALEEVL